ncbi:hypothetical protein [Paenibacillus sp. SYP-B4298]|uniref:hypothetical protein n=1 Tax=Paenibacillus sp. SYP-B4298 TaxID=2996034 RepID=UPI0022DD9650|nr:hypothetical protein [Paenibacillus sp. SYP-B4298]
MIIKDARYIRRRLHWIFIILTIGYAPVAFGVWVLRMLGSSNYASLRASDWIWGGVILIYWGASYTSMDMGDKLIAPMWLYIALGIVLVLRGIIQKSENEKRVKSYYNLLTERGGASLAELSQYGEYSMTRLMNELEHLFASGKLPRGFIHFRKDRAWVELDTAFSQPGSQMIPESGRAVNRARESQAVVKDQNLSNTIILLLFFLWPVAIILCIARYLLNHKRNYLQIQDLRLGTAISAAAAVLYMLIANVALVGTIILLIVVVGTGGLLFWRTKVEEKALIGRSKVYAEMFEQETYPSLAAMGNRVQMSPEAVMNELYYMFQRQLLPVGEVDSSRMVAYLYDNSEMEQTAASSDRARQDAPRVQGTSEAQGAANGGGAARAPRHQECPGCGAKRLLHPGDVKECEYCGMELSYSG